MPDKLHFFVPFLLYRVMARLLRQGTSYYAKLGLSLPEARVLIVAEQHKGRVRAGMLSEITCIEASALSHILRHLSRLGFVSRERVQADNRSVDVTLTQEGREIARVCARISRKQEKVLLRGFSAQAQNELRSSLKQMYENAADRASNGDMLTLLPGPSGPRKRIAQKQRKRLRRG